MLEIKMEKCLKYILIHLQITAINHYVTITFLWKIAIFANTRREGLFCILLISLMSIFRKAAASSFRLLRYVVLAEVYFKKSGLTQIYRWKIEVFFHTHDSYFFFNTTANLTSSRLVKANCNMDCQNYQWTFASDVKIQRALSPSQ